MKNQQNTYDPKFVKSHNNLNFILRLWILFIIANYCISVIKIGKHSYSKNIKFLNREYTFLSLQPKNEKVAQIDDSETADFKEINGGADGTRTRDLQRDRLAF